MDLFSVVRLAKPAQVTVGVRPLREGEIPILEATVGRTYVQEEPANVAQPLLVATPVQNVPSQEVPAPEPARTESSEGVGIFKVDTDSEEASQRVKRKASGDGGEGTTKRRRHVITVDESTDEEVSLSVAARDTAETSFPM
jgi:hypothetical protein